MKKFKKNPKYTEQNVKTILTMFEEFDTPMELVEVLEGRHAVHIHLRTKKATRMAAIEKFQKDLEYALESDRVYIQAPIPGKKLIGVTIPQDMPEFLYPERVVNSTEYKTAKGSLVVPFGVTEFDDPVVHDIATFPHLLVAGTTHSGKSTFLHHLITSLISRYAPKDLGFILMDPKAVEMTVYDTSPHMLVQPITELKRIVAAMHWLGKEMERRYELLKKHRVIDINEYHALKKAEHPMPYIVAVIDELADVMQAYPRELEGAIVRLAQKSRAVGIHLILSTQRPSVDVVTGQIKANLPARIAFKVSSTIESRITIDSTGAERLAGKGDGILVVHGETVRFQTPLITRQDVRKQIERSIKKYGKTPPPFNKAVSLIETHDADYDDSKDEMYDRIEEFVMETRRASTSLIQRKFKIGFGRAARLMDMLEENSIISPSDGTARPRDVIRHRAGDIVVRKPGDRRKKEEDLYREVESFVIQEGRASTALIQRRFNVGYGTAARLMDKLEESGLIAPSDGTIKPREVIEKKK